MTEDYFQFNIHIGYLMFRISYLNPNTPFYRESCDAKTLALQPFKATIPHMEVTNKKALGLLDSEEYLFYLFSLSLSIVEKQETPNNR
ncbi:MAG: hypothetical protein HRT71_06490 [Flavobacteriales bacterium]|nr:hypothetical protein [Flavobacteriales bacterium]